jgi:hypothetical protein
MNINIMNWYKFIKLGGQMDDLAVKLLSDNPNKQHYIELLNNYPSKLKPLVAYFLNQNINQTQIRNAFNKTKQLLINNKIVVSFNGNIPQLDGKSFTDWIKFEEQVDAIHHNEYFKQMETKDKQLTKEEIADVPIISKNGITIYESHSRDKCIQFGKGTSFCVSQPGNSNWQAYRDEHAATFYFIFDKNKLDNDPLSIVVLDYTSEGIELTDKSNNTGIIAEHGKNVNSYLAYLQANGINTNIFKNKPLTEEEIEDEENFGKKSRDLKWFIKLSPIDKSKYIGRGHALTDEQFKWLVDNNIKPLVLQYLENPDIHHTIYDFIRFDKEYLKKMKHVRKHFIKINRHIGYFDYRLFTKDEILSDKDLSKIVNDMEECTLYLFKKDKNFDLNSIPKEIMDKISRVGDYSFALAQSVDFDLSRIPQEVKDIIYSNPDLAFNFVKGVRFELNKIPIEILDTIAKDDIYSYNFAQYVNFDLSKIPKEMIIKIAQDSYYSYDFARNVYFDLNRVPKEIVDAANDYDASIHWKKGT